MSLTKVKIEKILNGRFEQDGFLSLSNLPHPSSFKDMNRATERIVQAIRKQEKIVLIGDYDVDGIVSTTLMKLFFNEIGIELEWIIPNRFKDGYGLSATVVSRIKDYDLAITVDNGISAVEASLLCKEYNIELIITDHHLLPDILPEAYAIIDQKQEECNFPYDEVCGAQIAWYLIASLNKALKSNINIKSYIALVSIAIIADIMPLQHINRAMVLSGLQLLSQSQLPAIKAFMERLDKVNLNAEDIGFQIAPILNSAGRMDDAKWSVEFLLSSNKADATIRLERLVEFNNSRKLIEQKITNEALTQVDPNDNIIVVYGDDWHEGVVGIVAARVGRTFEKPTIVLTKSKEGNLKGSGRSFHICNLFKITESCRELLDKFGGHHAAIGLTLPLKNLEPFKKKLQQNYLNENYNEAYSDPDVLGILNFSEINFDLTNMMRQYEPFGQGNPRPKFVTHNVIIQEVVSMGKEKEHRRFTFAHNGAILQGVMFKTDALFQVFDRVSVVYTINENHFNNRINLQLMVEKVL